MKNIKNQSDFDVAIIGSGIAGSTLACILAKQGLKVIVFEAGEHPKFTIGESLILETSEVMRSISEIYDIPELLRFSSEHYLDQAGTSHGVKRHFGFMHHEVGKNADVKHSLQAVIPEFPHGHELHLYRQDVDYFLMQTAIEYGATVVQNCKVEDVEIGKDAVKVKVNKLINWNVNKTKSSDPTNFSTSQPTNQITASFLVDSSGFRSVIADKLKLRTFDQQTHSRGMFTHMTGVKDIHSVTKPKEDFCIPFSMHEGTLHHVFDGGWIWIIPFDNHKKSTNQLVSVGLILDPRTHPENKDLTPEEEFYSFIDKFPAIKNQLAEAKAVRPWVRAPRLQYGTKQVVGERWALLGHAAGFIDPLYSKGIYTSLQCVNVLADQILTAHKKNSFNVEDFIPLQEMTLNYLQSNDRMVANSFKSWQNYKLWPLMSTLWLIGAYTEYLKLITLRIELQKDNQKVRQSDNQNWLSNYLTIPLTDYYSHITTSLSQSGGGYPEYFEIEDQLHSMIEKVDPTDEKAIDQVVKEFKQVIKSTDWIPQPFKEVIDGKTTLPKNKIGLHLLKKNTGFLGTPSYRKHFFGDAGYADLLKAFFLEWKKYS